MDEGISQQVIITPSSISASNSPGYSSNSPGSNSASDSEDKISGAIQKKAQPPKNKQKSSEASARFRSKRRLKQQKMLDAIERENSKIELYKSKMKKLQVENELLKKMVLGPSIPSPLEYNDVKLSQDIGSSIGNMSNYELHKRLNRDEDENL